MMVDAASTRLFQSPSPSLSPKHRKPPGAFKTTHKIVPPFGHGYHLPRPNTAGITLAWPPPRHIRSNLTNDPEPIYINNDTCPSEPSTPPPPTTTTVVSDRKKDDSVSSSGGGSDRSDLVYDSEEQTCVVVGSSKEEGDTSATRPGPARSSSSSTTTVRGDHVMLQPWYRIQGFDDDTLVFESRFEGGNLYQAVRRGPSEYDLILQPDTNTSGHTQWYYFQMTNTRIGPTYKFNIVNFYKNDSLYQRGMKPLFYSKFQAQRRGIGWVRTGKEIRYSPNSGTRDFTVSFQLTFPYGPEDVCYLAYSYPFTYTDLTMYLEELGDDPLRRRHFRRRTLCETPMGNRVDLLTITNYLGVQGHYLGVQGQDGFKDRKGVVISARVHPGESNSSWICKGLLDFLTSEHEEAKALRDSFIFKIVPMLNPDGCLLGNHRCSVAGLDLNRVWIDPNPRSTPEIHSFKRLISQFSQDRDIVLYCDLHGHSKMFNCFLYGCDPALCDGGKASKGLPPPSPLNHGVRLFPYWLSKIEPTFSYGDCSFDIEKFKETTGRVVAYRELGIPHSFTLEASALGPNMEGQMSYHYNIKSYEHVGESVARAILKTFGGANEQVDLTAITRELNLSTTTSGGGCEREGEEGRRKRLVVMDVNSLKDDNASDTGDSDDEDGDDNEGDKDSMIAVGAPEHLEKKKTKNGTKSKRRYVTLLSRSKGANGTSGGSGNNKAISPGASKATRDKKRRGGRGLRGRVKGAKRTVNYGNEEGGQGLTGIESREVVPTTRLKKAGSGASMEEENEVYVKKRSGGKKKGHRKVLPHFLTPLASSNPLPLPAAAAAIRASSCGDIVDLLNTRPVPSQSKARQPVVVRPPTVAATTTTPTAMAFPPTNPSRATTAVAAIKPPLILPTPRNRVVLLTEDDGMTERGCFLMASELASLTLRGTACAFKDRYERWHPSGGPGHYF